jgi:hypothetical protein
MFHIKINETTNYLYVVFNYFTVKDEIMGRSCDDLPHELPISIFPEILSNKVDFGTEKLMEAFLTDIPFFTAATAADMEASSHDFIFDGKIIKNNILIICGFINFNMKHFT